MRHLTRTQEIFSIVHTSERVHEGPVEDMAFEPFTSRLASCGFPAPAIFKFEKKSGVLLDKKKGSTNLDFCQRNVFFNGNGTVLVVLLLESHEV
jgi:WD40 repeat protein